MATTIIDNLSNRVKVITINALTQNEWSDLVDTVGAISVYITVNGVGVTMYLPNYDTATDEWLTDGTNARTNEYEIATGTGGATENPRNTTSVGVIPGNYMPPKIQFQNTNASNRNIVIYLHYPAVQ